MINEIRESIKKVEEKGYEINKIFLSEEIAQLLVNECNKVFGDNAIDIDELNTLYGYNIGINYINNSPVAFWVTIPIEKILKGSDNNDRIF